MLKNLIVGILGISMLLVGGSTLGSAPRPGQKGMEQILTKEDSSIITPPNEVNPLVKGTQTAVKTNKHTIKNISNSGEPFDTQESATEKTLKYLQNLINWALGMAAFVALIVVLYGGFQMLTAAGNDAKFKSGKTAMKKVAIGLIGIGVSWMIVSLIFRFIGIIIK